jgi:hypothetical protein
VSLPTKLNCKKRRDEKDRVGGGIERWGAKIVIGESYYIVNIHWIG